MSTEKPVRVYTSEEWNQRIREATDLAERLLPIVEGMTTKPGRAVLAFLIAGQGLCFENPALPDFGWYCDIVIALGEAAKDARSKSPQAPS